MHATTTRSHHRSISGRALLAGAALIAGAMAGASPAGAIAAGQAAGGPRLVHGDVADVLVRVQGISMCSGTPITGTAYVVTAAHCVLDHEGDPVPATVVRGGVTYSAAAVLVDERYAHAPGAVHDAAVLVMDQAVPGPSATIGTAIPTTGSVTIAGLQSLDSDGTLLRGTDAYDAPAPKGVTGTLIEIASAPAGCTMPTTSLSLVDRHIDVPCGLIPGASGGGMFANVHGRITVVGIVSTVTRDMSVNGIVPLASLHELLLHPETYRHELTPAPSTGDTPHAVLS